MPPTKLTQLIKLVFKLRLLLVIYLKLCLSTSGYVFASETLAPFIMYIAFIQVMSTKLHATKNEWPTTAFSV